MAACISLLVLAILVLSHIQAASVPVVLPEESSFLPPDDVVSHNVYKSDINKFGFSTIRNSSIPCNSISQYMRAKYRFYTLSDEDKLGMLELSGGHFRKEYMAVDEMTARETFPMLLEVDSQLMGMQQDWAPTKAAVRHWLDETVEKEEEELNGTGVNVHSRSNSTQQQHQQQQQQHAPRKGRHSMLVLPREVGLPDYIANDNTGDISKLEMCLMRGDKTWDNMHLYLCTRCSATTNLGETHWPPIINEALCLQADPFCFITADHTAHGKCKQKAIPIWVLKKREGFCLLGLKNDQVVIVDEWYSTQREVQIGCECVINVSSEFAQYVGRYGSL